MATSTPPPTVVLATPEKRKNSRFRLPQSERFRNELTGWMFVAPATLIIGVFGIFPIIYATYMSLYRWRLQQGRFYCEPDGVFSFDGCFENYTKIIGDWGGLGIFVAGIALILVAWWLWERIFISANSRRRVKGHRIAVHPVIKYAFSFVVLIGSLYLISYGWGLMMVDGNDDYLNGLIYTLYYALGSIPLQLGLGLILAYVLFQNIRGKQLFRMIFFIPYITPAVAAAVVFRIVFSPRDSSLANQVVISLGGDALRWVQEPKAALEVLFSMADAGGPSLAMVSVVILGIWQYTGYNAVIFLAGLGNISSDLYEAARVDGANEWHIFRHITIPLLSPITFYLSILGFIGTFKAFNTLFVMRTPQALNTTDTASIVVFDTFFKASRYGEAAAQAILLMIIIVAITQFQRNVLEKRVFYG